MAFLGLLKGAVAHHIDVSEPMIGLLAGFLAGRTDNLVQRPPPEEKE